MIPIPIRPIDSPDPSHPIHKAIQVMQRLSNLYTTRAHSSKYNTIEPQS